MLLTIQLAALALGGTASCPSNLANDLAAPPADRQRTQAALQGDDA